MVAWQEYQLVNSWTALEQATVSFWGPPLSSLSIPWHRAGKGNPGPYNPCVQLEEVRAVIITVFLNDLGPECLRQGQIRSRVKGKRFGPWTKRWGKVEHYTEVVGPNLQICPSPIATVVMSPPDLNQPVAQLHIRWNIYHIAFWSII